MANAVSTAWLTPGRPAGRWSQTKNVSAVPGAPVSLP